MADDKTATPTTSTVGRPPAASALDELSKTAPHELTQAAHDRLKAEYIVLTTEKKIEIARKIEVAREMGDLSENGDYHAAKEEQGEMAGRIAHLNALLENHVIVEAGGSAEIHVGSIVTVRYEGDTDTEKYLVGSIEEQSQDLDVISPGSALGVSLMGQAKGATVRYETPTGATLAVEVVDVE